MIRENRRSSRSQQEFVRRDRGEVETSREHRKGRRIGLSVVGLAIGKGLMVFTSNGLTVGIR